jgi:hypothetical protein
LRIAAPRKNYPNGDGGPIVEVRKEIPFHPFWPHPIDLETNLPEGPMPTNVKDFKLIYLRFAIAMCKLIFNIKKNVRIKSPIS